MKEGDPKKVVLITGAGGLLGSALVRIFTTEGWHVVAAVRKRAGESAVLLDVTQSEQVTQVVNNITEQFGRIDVLINNAGVTADGLCSQLSETDWSHVLDVNLRGAFLCSKAVARPMMRQREGQIVNVSSFGARSGPVGQSNYAASKAGLVGLTQSLAKELGSRNVRVNAVFPGVMPSRMTAHLSADRLEHFAKSNALGRINSSEEVARFIAFLVTTQNISGQVFQLDSRIAPWT